MDDYFIGIDVGTGSVRAAVFDSQGHILSTSASEIKIWNTQSQFYEQSSDNIWETLAKTVKKVVADSCINPVLIKGVGFDATCSLVVLDHQMEPCTVSTEGGNDRNIILWMDHRAHKEAEEINSTKHYVLDTVGGSMSLEMQLPKLKWLKKNLPKTWMKAHHFMDLPDFLTWRATGSLSRSTCSLGCKWSYQAEEGAWDNNFLTLIGLEDFVSNHQKIGKEVKKVGSSCGDGLSQAASQDLGLLPGTAVGTSIIDAHAGALGCLSCHCYMNGEGKDIDHCLVLIAGTSNCHIVSSSQKIQVKGVWGPYYNAMIPGMWVSEGGQSAAGSLIDHITSKHPAFLELKKSAGERGVQTYTYMNMLVEELAYKEGNQNSAFLTKNLHIWPDFHGNRSPLADPTVKGMISGLDLSSDETSLILLYLSTLQALAYSTRFIIKAMEKAGHSISTVYVCGGLSKNRLFVQTHSDVLGLPVIVPETNEPVLLGAAILGMCAFGHTSDIREAMCKLGCSGTMIEPQVVTQGYHSMKYAVFQEMIKDQRKYQDLMFSKDWNDVNMVNQ